MPTQSGKGRLPLGVAGRRKSIYFRLFSNAQMFQRQLKKKTREQLFQLPDGFIFRPHPFHSAKGRGVGGGTRWPTRSLPTKIAAAISFLASGAFANFHSEPVSNQLFSPESTTATAKFTSFFKVFSSKIVINPRFVPVSIQTKRAKEKKNTKLFNALRLLLQFPPPLQNCFLSQKRIYL